MRASIHTLGCRLNQADSARIAAELRQGGYELVPWGDCAELLVVNGCAVTGTAVQKTRQLLRSARRRCPEAYIVLCGCPAGMAGNAGNRDDFGSELSGLADLLVPNPKPPRLLPLLPAHLDRGAASRILRRPWLEDGFVLPGVAGDPGRTRANLKIQEGCDYRCTYCIVPDARGPAVSRGAADVLREAAELLELGYRELVITGVNVATYSDSGLDLAGLLGELLALRQLGGDFRIRLSSTEPGPSLERVVDLMRNDRRICRFLHLPLQYGDDGILRRMGRHYDTAKYAELVRGAAAAVPGLCLGTDLMVGFPGEDDAAFRTCREFLEGLPLGLMHVFSYSPRPGTPAAGWERPPAAAVAQRERAMLELSRAKSQAFLEAQRGTPAEILLEHGAPAGHGWSDNYLKVVLGGAAVGRGDGFIRCRVGAVLDAGAREVKGELSE